MEQTAAAGARASRSKQEDILLLRKREDIIWKKTRSKQASKKSYYEMLSCMA